MRTMGRGSTVLVFLAAACLGACGVGTYHIPDVPPVVKPEPEEDMFKDLELDDEPAAPATESGGEKKAEPAPAPAAPSSPEAPKDAAKPSSAEPAKPKDAAKPSSAEPAKPKAPAAPSGAKPKP